MNYLKHFRLLSLLIAILMGTIIASCGDDEEKDGTLSGDDLIIKASGTWMCTQSVDTQYGETYQGLMIGKEITISPNGTYTSTAPTFGYTGTYVVSGNKITARSDAGGTFLINVSISDDRMTWDGTANNGVTFRYIFERESSVVPTEKAFTKEIIAGDFQWKVMSVSIKRGSDCQMTEGKTIRFKEDGTCEAFHSMETAWRINNGRVETYYQQTEEPMFVYTLLAVNDNEIKVRIDGTLDDNLQAEVVLVKESIPNSVTIEEDVFGSKEQILSIYNSCYAACVEFEKAQLELEEVRINPSTVHQITPNSATVSNAWQYAYQTVNRINLVLDKKEMILSSFGNQEGGTMIAELRALRAFVNYNLAMLWGKVPLVKEVVNVDNSYVESSSQSVVLQFAFDEINDVVDALPSIDEIENGRLCFNRDAGRMLKAELLMALGSKSQAVATLNQIDRSRYSNTRSVSTNLDSRFIWALYAPQNNYCPVYTVMHVDLYLYESAGSKDGLILPTIDLNKDGVLDEDIDSFWHASDYTDYGYWAFLKRTGKAQDVTGCYDFELLMPIPYMDIMTNPRLMQNPGY